MLLKYYKGSILFTLVMLVISLFLGWHVNGSLPGMLSVVWIVIVLSVLEVSLSFDNAVVNATVLKEMTPVWQHRFLTWGILFAVFGMRIVFPLVIVAIAAKLGPIDALVLAATHSEEYERILTDAHIGIAGFGGAFLGIVGLRFFFDSDKEVHWIYSVERSLAKFSNIHSIEIGILLLALYGVSTLLPAGDNFTFLISGIFGLLSFIAVEAVGTMLKAPETVSSEVARSGLASFLYLEVLDASFSFDGVVGAFALSNNMFIIALGLGIGAIFVRSMTIMLVDQGTLTEYRYLEHGAFWAILALAGIMLLSARFHIPEVVTGLLGGVLIGLSFWWSIRWNQKQRPRYSDSP
jgi:hypothetical protein